MESGLWLVRAAAARFSLSGDAREDLIQAGCLGLAQAAARFDPRQGARFTTYALPFVLGEMRRAARGCAGGPAVGSAGADLLRRARAAREGLAAELGREPALDEVATRIGAPSGQLSDLLAASLPPLTLDELELAASAGAGARGAEDWDGVLERLDLRRALGGLDERERRIVLWRFFAGLPQREAARRLGISQPHASRLEHRALARLRQLLAWDTS